LNEVNRIIFDLIHANDASDKIAGIMAIGILYVCSIYLLILSHYLRSCLPGNDPAISVYASKALGNPSLFHSFEYNQ
jgi:hypothetical protein